MHKYKKITKYFKSKFITKKFQKTIAQKATKCYNQNVKNKTKERKEIK